MKDATNYDDIPGDPKPLHYIKLREASAITYSIFRCAGPLGCGERVSTDALGEHAAKQHNTYDYDQDTTVKAGG